MPAQSDHPFAAEFKRLLRARGLSQAEAARILERPQSLVSRWERGITLPTWQNVQRIADVFGADVQALWALVTFRASDASDSTRLSEGDLTSPAVRTEMEEAQRRLAELLAGVPRPMWAAYLDANERMADDLTATYERARADALRHFTGTPQQSLSLPPAPPLSAPPPESADGDEPPPQPPLSCPVTRPERLLAKS